MKTGPVPMDDNTLYRTLNDARVDWRKMLMSFALQFTRVVNRESEEPDKGTRCLVVDDSTLEKSGKTIEGVSRVNDHAKGGYTFGFKFLLLGFFDGTMLIPADFSLHRESQKTNFGLTKEEQRKQHESRNPKDSHGETRKRELDEKKTDMKIGFNRAMEIYQVRWTIEVLFKECRQYLRLGKSQNTSFNGQVADTTLALITYTILSLGKRFGSYETLGALFRANKQEMLERAICERIMHVVLTLIMRLLEFMAIDIDETMRLLVENVFLLSDLV